MGQDSQGATASVAGICCILRSHQQLRKVIIVRVLIGAYCVYLAITRLEDWMNTFLSCARERLSRSSALGDGCWWRWYRHRTPTPSMRRMRSAHSAQPGISAPAPPANISQAASCSYPHPQPLVSPRSRMCALGLPHMRVRVNLRAHRPWSCIQRRIASYFVGSLPPPQREPRTRA